MSKKYKKLPVGIEIECQWCGEIHTAEEWSEYSLAQCSNRQMRRDFKPLEDVSIYNKKSDVYYKCKSCGNWSGGWQLTIANTEDEELRRLGGGLLASIGKQDNTK